MVVAIAALAIVRPSFADNSASFFGIIIDRPLKFDECARRQGRPQRLPDALCWAWALGEPNPKSAPMFGAVVWLPWSFPRMKSYVFGASIGIQLVDAKVQYIRYQTRGAGVQDEAIQELTAELGKPTLVSSKNISNNVGPDVISKEVDWDVGDVHVHFSGAEETLAGHPGQGLVVATTALFRSILESRARARTNR